MVEISGIKVASRGPMTDGVFKVASGGLIWKKTGGGRHIDIPPADISSMRWTKIGKYCQLCVKRHQHPSITFTGFRDQDLESLADVCKQLLRVKIEEKHMAAHGRNWGDANIEGTQLDFVSADSKLCFAVNLSDVIQAQLSGNKNDVQLSFQTDDTGGRGIDSLCEMAIYVPAAHPEYAAAGEDEENPNASKAFLETVLQKTDAGAVTSADAIVTFSEVAVLAPRGRFDVEMHASFLKLYGQSQEFRVAFSSISRLFILPKTQQPHTLVAISLDPPIRKGQTFYNHILCQFPTDEEVEVNLDISDELLESKNEQCGKKLHRDFQGSSADVFSRVLRGLAAAKITRPGNFRAADDTALAIKCSYKADLGHLYPLERAFFYINKPPLLITHEEIEGVEFQRQGNDSLAVAKTFDLLFRLKNDQEHQFRNIQRNEWANLFEWMQAKNLRIENLAEAQQGPGGPGRGLQLDDGGASDDDEDFAMGSGDDDDGEPSDEDSDDSGSDVNSADMSGDEDGEPEAKSKPKAKKEKPKPKEKARKSDEKEKAPPKKRAKKDKNAPKKGMSAFMMFSNKVRDSVRSENPDAAFGDIGKIIGARWKAMEAGDKTEYDEMAAKDKARYEREMADYKEKLAAAE